MPQTLAVRNEVKCKICQHPKRNEIDQLLLKRSFRESDGNGNLVTGDYIIKQLREWDFVNPNSSNLRMHWKKHCEVVHSDHVGTAHGSNLSAIEILKERMLARDIGPDSYTDDLIDIGEVSLREQVANNILPKISVDQVLKAIDTKTRRRHNEKVVELLDLQAEAMSLSIAEETQPKAIEAEIVESEDE